MTSSSVFSMFGGGAKKEKKEDEDRGDNSGSAKAQRDAAAAEKGEVRPLSARHSVAATRAHRMLMYPLYRAKRRLSSPRTFTSSPSLN